MTPFGWRFGCRYTRGRSWLAGAVDGFGLEEALGDELVVVGEHFLPGGKVISRRWC